MPSTAWAFGGHFLGPCLSGPSELDPACTVLISGITGTSLRRCTDFEAEHGKKNGGRVVARDQLSIIKEVSLRLLLPVKVLNINREMSDLVYLTSRSYF